jgi:CubicO group peptidase (beta-lactamase class C family)
MKLIFKFALLCIAFFNQHAVNAQPAIEKIDSMLTALHADGKINGSILIAKKGVVVYQKSFGIANEITKAPINNNTIFELASVSKQFTAMAIMMLSERKKLNLNADFATYLPELSHYKGISVQHLVHHTSGLPDYMELMDPVFDKTKIATNKDLIAFFAKEKPNVKFKPNSKFEYSNTGYALLASIIEATSGMTYAQFLQKNIFEPLQMTNTSIYNRRFAPRTVENYALDYVFSDSLQKLVLSDDDPASNMVVWLDGIVGDGTVNSNTSDLLRWDRALYTNALLRKKNMKKLFTAATLADKTKSPYGFGWGLQKHKDFGTIYSHSGGWGAYVSYIERHTDNDITIILLQNHSGVSLPIKNLRYFTYNLPLPIVKPRVEIAIPQEKLMEYVGIYEIETDITITMAITDGQLTTQLTGQDPLPVFAEKEDFFFLKVVDAQLQFSRDENGKIIQVSLLQNGNTISALRIK